MSKSPLHQILDRSGFSQVTKDKYALVIDRWIEFAGADPGNWTQGKAQEFYDQLIDNGLKPASANTYLASLRYVSAWYARKTKHPDFAIVQKQRGKKERREEDDAQDAPILTEDEGRKLVLACAGGSPLDRRDFAMVVLALETGMRRMSLRGAEFEGLSTKRGYPTLRVPIKGAGGEEVFTVPLSDTANAALQDWLDWLKPHGSKSQAIFCRLVKRVHGSQRYFEAGDAVSLTTINEVIEGRAKQADIRHVNPHLLRHTFIAWRHQAGLSPFDIAEITGHKVTAVVEGGMRTNVGAMGTYIHRDVEAIRNATPGWLAELVATTLKGSR